MEAEETRGKEGILKNVTRRDIDIGVDSMRAGGQCPLGSDTEGGGKICLAPSVFSKYLYYVSAEYTHVEKLLPCLKTVSSKS